METNDRLELAQKIINGTDTSLFLTGKAGTGKTTFLRNLRDTSRKRMIVTAPTGIAAINAGGMTLHSFFQLDFGPFIPGARRDTGNRRSLAFSKEKIRIIRGLDLLVIDEVSMVRADLLDAVDDVLRRYRDRNLPFGGVQLLLIGDLQQLPPVVTNAEKGILEANYRSPYFFDSHALGQLNYATVELTEVYRQSDRKFIDILNAVRENRTDRNVLDYLNARCKPGFSPSDEEGYVRLTTHNHLANEINRQRMDLLPTPSFFFDSVITGNFPESSYPAEKTLELKEGAQVMFIKNDIGAERRYFNGMLGRITAIDEEGVTVTPADSYDQINVEPAEWENVKYVVNEDTKEIAEIRDGVFRQLPLRPAWAITIHKSQGLTFDRAIIDASLSFTHGQTYVALSRCRSLEGLVLERPVTASSIINDPLVSDYMRAHSSDISGSELSQMTNAYRLHLMESIFNFRPMFNAIEGIMRILKENFTRLYGTRVTEIGDKIEALRKSMTDVGERFSVQLRRIAADHGNPDSEALLIKRVKDACAYFSKQLREVSELLKTIPTEHDNKKVKQKLAERFELYRDIEAVKEKLLEVFAVDDFDVDHYLDVKAQGAFRSYENRKKGSRLQHTMPTDASASNPNPELFDTLCKWRRARADELDVPAYTVASTKALMGVAEMLPRTKDELLMIAGLGPATVRRIGDALVSMVEEYLNSAHVSITLPSPQKKAAPKKKKVKGESARLSHSLWIEGKSIEEIAKERNLAVSTIEGHIIEIADLTDPAIRGKLISPETDRVLHSYYDTHPVVPGFLNDRMAEIEKTTGIMPKPVEVRIVEKDYPDLVRLRETPPSDDVMPD